jgi:hypothetical protein
LYADERPDLVPLSQDSENTDHNVRSKKEIYDVERPSVPDCGSDEYLVVELITEEFPEEYQDDKAEPSHCRVDNPHSFIDASSDSEILQKVREGSSNGGKCYKAKDRCHYRSYERPDFYRIPHLLVSVPLPDSPQTFNCEE